MATSNTNSRLRILGFEARSERICDVLRTEKGEFRESERSVIAVVWDVRQAQAWGEIMKRPEGERFCNFGKR